MRNAGPVLGKLFLCLTLIALLPATAFGAPLSLRTVAAHAPPPSGPRANPFCNRLGKSIAASSGAQMFCFGPQRSFRAPYRTFAAPQLRLSGLNVDAANFSEDVTASGVRAYGQSETSIAAVDTYVVEAWNDATGLYSLCPSSGYKEEITGFAFSADGGKTFTDLGGLPNNDCKARYGGDPSVEAYKTAAGDFFYISSLYNNADGTGASYIAMAACQVAASGASSSLFCSQPIRIAQSSACQAFSGLTFCNFLDKDFLTIDPKRGKLYAAFDEFSSVGADSGRSEIAVCDIGSATGATGPAGGTAAAPVCPQGAIAAPSGTQPPPYLVLSADTTCENEGNYPDVDKNTGDVYDAWEYNWGTNLFSFSCVTRPTAEQVVRVPESCLRIAAKSPCNKPAASNAIAITALEAAFIPGYSRTPATFPVNDFPRIAVSERYGTVSLVWNDARYRPTGDILLASFKLGSLAPAQFAPTRLSSNKGATWVFLPALRNEDRNGRLNVAWYDRRLSPPSNGGGAGTDVYAALAVSPTATRTPNNVRVTNFTSDWNAASSDISPNFGDYTDDYVIDNPASPTGTGNTLYLSWTDGRYADPQPFESNLFIY